MAAPVSPHRYEADLEENSNGDESSSSTSEPVMTDKDSAYPHPDDSMHQHWYETTCRLRCVFYVFFSLAVMMAIAMGTTTEIFFSLMATPPSEGLSFGVIVGVVFVPVFLLITSVYVDECVDVGLDAADRPCFGLWRATISTAAKSISPRIYTDHVEKFLIFLIEGLPIIFSTITVALADSLTFWYKDVFRGYCLGGLVFALVVCVTYIGCHIFVGHNPERDELMACTYHNMRPLGMFRRIIKCPQNPDDFNSESHWGRCIFYLTVGIVLEVLVIFIFVFFHQFHCVFIGQLLATIFWAMAVRNFAPRLLGKAFWFTFVFFIVLTVGLMVGTMAQTTEQEVKQENSTVPGTLPPMAYGPGTSEYQSTQDYGGLPRTFVLSPWAPNPGYPVCKSFWGGPGAKTAEEALGILDLAVLAFASSFQTRFVRAGLTDMLNGTGLDDWELLEVESGNTVGRWIVVKFKKKKLRVIAVRGTSNVQDVFADLKLYSSVAVLQFMAILTPVLSLMPASVTRRLVDNQLSLALFGNKPIWDPLERAAQRHQKEAREQGEVLLMTGHSLGGALVGAVSSRIGVDGIGFSPPGLYYQILKYNVNLKSMYKSFTLVQPANDVVPRVDKQRGMIEWIDCDTSAPTCHRLTHTACELWANCGDFRKRDWRKTCSQWYSEGDINVAHEL